MMLAALMLLVAQDATVDCDNQRNQREMTLCAERDYQEADAALDQQWKVTLRGMKNADKAYDELRDPTDTSIGYADALLEAQRAWLKYRDAQCVIEGYLMRGGTAEPMMRFGCLAHLTKLRTAELAELTKGM